LAHARVPGAELTRKILSGLAPLRFGEGHDCTFAYALAVATKSEYDWIMGCSGAAFVTRIDVERWDPIVASPHDPATFARGARAVGVRLDPVVPPYDDEMRELVLARVVESIDGGSPPLVRGLGGPPEIGLLIGYDTEASPPPGTGPTFFARTFFDHGKEPTRVGWEAFEDEDHGTPLFLDPAPAPDLIDAAAAGLDAALELGPATDAALEAWIAALRDDARWTDAAHAGVAAFGDHAMRGLLADTRRAAARFLRQLRTLVANRPGADALRAAESYGYVADAAEKAGIGPFDGTVATRFLDGGQRRAWARLLEGALGHEREARHALRAARASLTR